MSTKSIGLASENNLPQAFQAKTHDNDDKVTILSPSGAKVTIETSSFTAVANILSTFAPNGEASLPPEARLIIKDEFSGHSTSITASHLGDIAKTMTTFAIHPGKYVPQMPEEDSNVVQASTEDKKAGRSKKTEATPSAVEDATHDEPAQTSSDAKPGRKKKADTASASEPAIAATHHSDTQSPSIAETPVAEKPKRGRKKKEEATEPAKAVAPETVAEAPKRRGRPPKQAANTSKTPETPASATKTTEATPSPAKALKEPKTTASGLPGAWVADRTDLKIVGAELPEAFQDLNAFYLIGDDEELRFDFTGLRMDDKKRRVVLGAAPDGEETQTWGYEIKSKQGEHLGWIIIEHDKLYMTGLPYNITVSSHRHMSGPINRASVAILNKIKAVRDKAA